jgi:oxaloacetate decarboxylase alpha subunit
MASKEKEEIDLEIIKKLISLMDSSQISELDVELGKLKVRIRKGSFPVSISMSREMVSSPLPAENNPSFITKEEIPSLTSPKSNLIPIIAPMVGTFYRGAAPDVAPYVEKGSSISPGQTICIIEAMKLMNEIQSEVQGKIVDILVDNGQPIEYGQPLFLVEPDSQR